MLKKSTFFITSHSRKLFEHPGAGWPAAQGKTTQNELLYKPATDGAFDEMTDLYQERIMKAKKTLEAHNKMKQVLLTDISRPKQWKTISANDLLDEGYPVYGANGKIGFYSSYTHESPTILITCRGATCGTINISEPKSYVNGNAMALDNLSPEVDLSFLTYYLRSRGLKDVISGSAQPQITRQNLKKVKIPLPPLATQKKIAAILDAADEHRQKTKALLEKYDELAQSIFLEMFGDPVRNEKGWEKIPVKKLGKVITGNTPSRQETKYYGDFVEWIKTDNINTPSDYLTPAKEYLSEKGLAKGRKVESGAVLITCIAGSKKVIGNSAIADRAVAFNQQINAFVPVDGFTLFWYHQFRLAKSYVQTFSTHGLKGIISKSNFEQIEFINPPSDLKERFSRKTVVLLKQKKTLEASIQKSEELFNSLLQRAFKGGWSNNYKST